MISIEDFKKIELKTATVVEVREHPGADRLYLVVVDDGQRRRQLVAGLRPYYNPEELEGKQVLVVTNLEPALITGQESEGMLLAAQEGDSLSVITTDKKVSNGISVR